MDRDQDQDQKSKSKPKYKAKTNSQEFKFSKSKDEADEVSLLRNEVEEMKLALNQLTSFLDQFKPVLLKMAGGLSKSREEVNLEEHYKEYSHD